VLPFALDDWAAKLRTVSYRIPIGPVTVEGASYVTLFPSRSALRIDGGATVTIFPNIVPGFSLGARAFGFSEDEALKMRRGAKAAFARIARPPPVVGRRRLWPVIP